jgi:hypothetical protein
VLFILSVFAYNYLLKHRVLTQWQAKNKQVSAKIVNSEIAASTLARSNSHQSYSTVWQYRLLVEFAYQSQKYQATPSVINRYQPGAKVNYYHAEAECQQALANYKSPINIEIDPNNPLDCEIAGQLQAQSKLSWVGVMVILLFCGAVIGFTTLFVFLAEQGHTYVKP